MLVRWQFILTCALGVALLRVTPLVAQSDTAAVRPPPHAVALAEMGRSGLRGLLSASGSIGDLQNRAGSYRMAVQMEDARTGPLEGMLSALDVALNDPALSDDERAGLHQVRNATLAELRAVPRYHVRYTTATLQAETLVPIWFLRDRPVFLLVRGRGHVRGGGPDGLTVFSEGVSIAPVLVSSSRFVVAPGLALGRVDVDIGPFDGSSGTTSLGPQLAVGAVLGEGWSLAAQLGHSWSHGRSTILRPQRNGPVEVRSEGWSETTTAKAELMGRWSILYRLGVPIVVRPRVGAFLSSTQARPTTSSLGDTGTGRFGARESLGAVRGGFSLEGSAPTLAPRLYLGWEQELADEMAVLVKDSGALLAAAGVGWSWSRGRRLVVDYTLLRGSEGLRRTSDFTIILIVDGY
jgi:hypothetical protein